MKRATVLAFAAGAALLFYLLRRYNWNEIFAAAAAAGWGVASISAYRFVTIATDAVGWRALFPATARPRLAHMVPIRWVGESVNSLLPVAQIGGDVARARLLAWDHGENVLSGAATVVDFTLGVVTQAVYTVLGMALLLGAHRAGQQDLAKAVAVSIGMMACAVVALYLMQQHSAFEKLALLGRKLLGGSVRILSEELHSDVGALDRSVNEIYGRRAALLRCAAWRFSTWMLHTVETWLALKFLGAGGGWSEALILESLGTAARSAAFFVPAGLGAQEGGFVLVGSALGLAPGVSLALSLVKRAREIAVGVPGLAVWGILEGKAKKTAG